MKLSLRTKLIISYILVTLVLVFLMGIVTNILLDRHFTEYIIRNQKHKNAEVASLVGRQFKGDQGWDVNAIEGICIDALKKGQIIRVIDSKDNLIWDARLHDNEQCELILDRMEENMDSRYFNWQGSYMEDDYPVTERPGEMGRVYIGYYGPYYFDDGDLAFINRINRLFTAVGIIALLLSFILGSAMSKKLSQPISGVVRSARLISRGFFGGRITEKSSTTEIDQLTETINDLAAALEKQEILRKYCLLPN